MPSYQLTHAQLEELWLLGGGSPDSADTAAAVAQAESGGCQYALAGPVDIRPVRACFWRVTTRENSCGFWQINLKAHPQYSAPSIFAQDVNASAAVAISSDGTDWSPWTTYTSGAYKQYLTGAGPPVVYTGAPLASGQHQVSQAWGQWMRSLGVLAPHDLRTVRAARSRIRKAVR